MGKDAVDAAAHSLGGGALGGGALVGGVLGGGVPRSITERVRLIGADGYETRSNQRAALSRSSGVHLARIDHLLHRYGGLVDELLDLIAGRPELGRPLDGAEAVSYT